MLIDVLPPDVTRTAPAGGPGAEVQRATKVAEQVARDLHATGHELSFTPSVCGGRVRTEVRDEAGHVVAELTPTQVLALACGEPFPGAPVGGEARWPWR